MNAAGILGLFATLECLLECHLPVERNHISHHALLGMAMLHYTERTKRRIKSPQEASKASNLDLE